MLWIATLPYSTFARCLFVGSASSKGHLLSINSLAHLFPIGSVSRQQLTIAELKAKQAKQIEQLKYSFGLSKLGRVVSSPQLVCMVNSDMDALRRAWHLWGRSVAFINHLREDFKLQRRKSLVRIIRNRDKISLRAACHFWRASTDLQIEFCNTLRRCLNAMKRIALDNQRLAWFRWRGAIAHMSLAETAQRERITSKIASLLQNGRSSTLGMAWRHWCQAYIAEKEGAQLRSRLQVFVSFGPPSSVNAHTHIKGVLHTPSYSRVTMEPFSQRRRMDKCGQQISPAQHDPEDTVAARIWGCCS